MAVKWSDIKKNLSSHNKRDFIGLIKEFYDASEENRRFLTTRTAPKESSLDPYKVIIEKAMYPDVLRNQGVNIAGARKAISSYKKASKGKDVIGVLDLMVFFIEKGTEFTAEYGDMYEQFYISLEVMFRDVLKILHKYRNASTRLVRDFIPRLEKIVEQASNMGWGYYDQIHEMMAESSIPNKFNVVKI